ncbi:UDP-N-acetylglucosamine transferase subunit ALG14 homolog [Pectinophora gossypiella]|uniref:UDP-N-acetylglucosamine transferase subunit ALG14 homolog n=1 Tax=Pectinophora gossypiella TaxID=13191 RepID=UPI00214F491A|nr:UDP-N-acetylglucosamine transferase subunit ALG14 homolog [Pectinophora gossypiella]
MAFIIVIVGLGALIAVFVIRALYLICQILTSNNTLGSSESSLRTILCIGSGGHTTELLRIMKNLEPKKYQPRLYIVADNDVSSEVKVHKAEEGQTKYALSRIPRSRNVQQSYISSVFSTLNATLHTVPVVYNFKPNIIFCNGPGTCVPVCVVAFLLRCVFILDCRIVFVESICRVRTLSLTGKILQYFADVIVVQWPQLRDVCFRAKYFGRLT